MDKGKNQKKAAGPSVPTSVPAYGDQAGTSAQAVGHRIAEVRGRTGQSEFAAELGVHVNTLSRYEGGRRMPDAEFVMAMVEKKNVSSHWLLFGVPPRTVIHPEENLPGRSRAQLRAEEPAAGYVYIPLYDVRAAAGRGSIIEDESRVDVLAFKESWIRQELRANPEQLRLIFVEGDSMEPDLRAGDIVLLDHNDTTARREGVYVIRMDGALLVKQVQRLPGGVVRVASRNPSYEPFTVPVSKLEHPDDFAIIGRVVWACRRF